MTEGIVGSEWPQWGEEPRWADLARPAEPANQYRDPENPTGEPVRPYAQDASTSRLGPAPLRIPGFLGEMRKAQPGPVAEAGTAAETDPRDPLQATTTTYYDANGQPRITIEVPSDLPPAYRYGIEPGVVDAELIPPKSE